MIDAGINTSACLLLFSLCVLKWRRPWCRQNLCPHCPLLLVAVAHSSDVLFGWLTESTWLIKKCTSRCTNTNENDCICLWVTASFGILIKVHFMLPQSRENTISTCEFDNRKRVPQCACLERERERWTSAGDTSLSLPGDAAYGEDQPSWTTNTSSNSRIWRAATNFETSLYILT